MLLLIPASATAEWQRWLDPAPHDFYHTADYHQFSEDSGEGRALLAVYGSPARYLAWPYLLRPIAGTPWRDIASVYGYPGPVAHGCRPGDAFLAAARSEITSLWRRQNAVSAFTRFHPLLENHALAESGDLHPGGQTVSVDLTLDDDACWRDYRRDLRQAVRRARRLGLTTGFDESWSRLDEFVALYHAVMARNGAAPSYFFPADYFRRLKEALGSHAFLLFTMSSRGTAAAAIIIEFGGAVHNHFCMPSEAFRELSPSKILLEDVRLWARARGNRVMHLGGGRGGEEDSLFAFKAGFSSRRHRFYTGRSILAPPIYADLSRSRAPDNPNYFPAYRAPEAIRPAAAATG
jgi:hypothetical protein